MNLSSNETPKSIRYSRYLSDPPPCLDRFAGEYPGFLPLLIALVIVERNPHAQSLFADRSDVTGPQMTHSRPRADQNGARPRTRHGHRNPPPVCLRCARPDLASMPSVDCHQIPKPVPHSRKGGVRGLVAHQKRALRCCLRPRGSLPDSFAVNPAGKRFDFDICCGFERKLQRRATIGPTILL